jgi:hypothetical protein
VHRGSSSTIWSSLGVSRDRALQIVACTGSVDRVVKITAQSVIMVV